VSAWDVGVTFGLDRMRRQVDDFLVRVASDLDVWYPHGALAVAWSRQSTSATLGVGVAASGAYASLPNPPSMGLLYQEFLAPALSRDATRSLTLGGLFGARHRVTELLAFEGQIRWYGTGARGTPAPYSPEGRYTRWEVEAGIVVGR
jgi:hypothetical protein